MIDNADQERKRTTNNNKSKKYGKKCLHYLYLCIAMLDRLA